MIWVFRGLAKYQMQQKRLD